MRSRTSTGVIVGLLLGVPASSTAATDAPRALDVLAFVVVEDEHQDGYDRSLFAEGVDDDGNGCDTRVEVLIRDTLDLPQIDPFGCHVLAGRWLSVYDDVTTTDPTLLDIDHVVALKEAWDSGAWRWGDQRRDDFANDLLDVRTLRAVTRVANQSKGDADPSNWLPPNEAFVCQYLADWIAIKVRWGLSMDQSEAGRIRNVLTERCPDQTIAPWPATAPWTPTLLSASVTTTTAAPVAIQPLVSGTCDASYPDVCIPPAPPDLDCGDVSYRRFTVLPPDPHGFDGDQNGVGCEG